MQCVCVCVSLSLSLSLSLSNFRISHMSDLHTGAFEFAKHFCVMGGRMDFILHKRLRMRLLLLFLSSTRALKDSVINTSIISGMYASYGFNLENSLSTTYI